jgi:hypothetical protein
MPEKDEFLPAELQCIENGHRFRERVWQKVHYVEDHDEPIFSTIPKGALDDVRCPVPGCGSLVQEAKD